LLLRAAYRLRDADLLLDAARRQSALSPDDPTAMNDLAAALIINRQDSKLLLSLTRRLLDAAPTSLAARLNHALALLQDGRSAAAKPLLLSIDESRLGEMERSMLALARTELAAQENRPAAALDFLTKVQRRFLLPPQVARLNELQAALKAKVAKAK
jgi:hypothetical protein